MSKNSFTKSKICFPCFSKVYQNTQGLCVYWCIKLFWPIYTSKSLFGAPREERFWIKRILLFSLFLDIFRVQRILLFPCFQTLFVFKGFCCFPVSRHFPYSRDFGVSLFPDTLTFQKCLETGKTTKSIEKIIIVKGFCHFSCL